MAEREVLDECAQGEPLHRLALLLRRELGRGDELREGGSQGGEGAVEEDSAGGRRGRTDPGGGAMKSPARTPAAATPTIVQASRWEKKARSSRAAKATVDRTVSRRLGSQ